MRNKSHFLVAIADILVPFVSEWHAQEPPLTPFSTNRINSNSQDRPFWPFCLKKLSHFSPFR